MNNRPDYLPHHWTTINLFSSRSHSYNLHRAADTHQRCTRNSALCNNAELLVKNTKQFYHRAGNALISRYCLLLTLTPSMRNSQFQTANRIEASPKQDVRRFPTYTFQSLQLLSLVWPSTLPVVWEGDNHLCFTSPQESKTFRTDVLDTSRNIEKGIEWWERWWGWKSEEH